MKPPIYTPKEEQSPWKENPPPGTYCRQIVEVVDIKNIYLWLDKGWIEREHRGIHRGSTATGPEHINRSHVIPCRNPGAGYTPDPETIKHITAGCKILEGTVYIE